MGTLEILKIYILGFGASSIIQSVFQRWFAENSYWKQNVGWQNEIVIWNIGMSIILYGLVQNSVIDIVEITLGLFVMSLLFFLNHVTALLKNKRSISHMMGSLINLLGMTVIIMKFAS